MTESKRLTPLQPEGRRLSAEELGEINHIWLSGEWKMTPEKWASYGDVHVRKLLAHIKALEIEIKTLNDLVEHWRKTYYQVEIDIARSDEPKEKK